MPQRQQTQGDFGLRPTKVTQGITDVYHAPSIPKPDMSGLQAIANLSKTAMGLVQEQHKLDIAHKKAGVEFGEANPNATLEEGGGLFTRGTTEAAMAGFEQGRGNALRETFRANVTNEWATLTEQNEDLKLQEEFYPAFLRQREAEFVQQQGIDGISLSSFGSGREAWMLDEIHKNNISSIKYRKDVFKTYMKEVTSSAIGNLTHISQLDRADSSTLMNYVESTFTDENDAGGQVNLPDGSWIGFRDLRKEDLDRIDVRDAILYEAKLERVESTIVPMIQEVLQRGYDIGGATEQEVRAAVADDLIASLKSGENPEETMMILNTLKSGTGLFRNTEEFTAKYEESRKEIEDNRVQARYNYNLQIDMWKLSNNIDSSTPIEEVGEAINTVRSNVGNYLTQEEAIKIEKEIRKNWRASNPARMQGDLDAFYAQTAFSYKEDSESYETRSARELSTLLEGRGMKVSESDITWGVETAIFREADRQGFQDLNEKATWIVSHMKQNGVFSKKGSTVMLTHKINQVANLITSPDDLDMEHAEEGIALYDAAKTLGMVGKLGLDESTKRLYNNIHQMRFGVRENERLTLSEAVANAHQLKAEFTSDYESVSVEDVNEEVGEDFDRSRTQSILELATAVQLRSGGTGAEAVKIALKIQEENGITTIDTRRSFFSETSRDFQLTEGSTQDDKLFNMNYEDYNTTFRAMYIKTARADDSELKAIMKDITTVGGVNLPEHRREFFSLESVTQDILEETHRAGELITSSERTIAREKATIKLRDRAVAIFEAENNRKPTQTQLQFRGAEDSDWAEVGLASTFNPSGEPKYYFINTATGTTLSSIGDHKLKKRYTASEIVQWLDSDRKEMENLRWERAEKERQRSLLNFSLEQN